MPGAAANELSFQITVNGGPVEGLLQTSVVQLRADPEMREDLTPIRTEGTAIARRLRDGRRPAFPPGVRDFGRYKRAAEHLRDAHVRSYDILKGGPGDFPVGLTVSMSDWWTPEGGEEGMNRARAMHEDYYLEATRGNDFIGVQAYTRIRIGLVPLHHVIEHTLDGERPEIELSDAVLETCQVQQILDDAIETRRLAFERRKVSLARGGIEDDV